MLDVLEIQSRIQRVEVFRTSALITRVAQVATEGRTGTLGLRLVNLPLLLRDDSLRVGLGGDGSARVVDAHLELRLGSREGSIDTEAQARLLELFQQVAELQVERHRHQDRVRFLEALAPSNYATVDLPDELAFAERHQLPAWLKLGDYVQTQLVAVRSSIRELDRKIEDLQDRIREAQDRLEKESQAESEILSVCRKAARLQIELPEARPVLPLSVSYLVPEARWFPEYELRVVEAREEAEVILKAMVAQRTGEDWHDVALAFSTADLRRSAQLPELDSWRIGKAQPLKPSGWRDLPDTIGEMFEGYDRGVRRLTPPPVPSRRSLPDMPQVEGVSKKGKAEVKRPASRMLAEKLRSVAEQRRQDDTRFKEAPDLSIEDDDVDGFYEETEATPEAEYEVSALMDAPEPAGEMVVAQTAALPAAPPSSMPPAKARRRSAGLLGAVAGLARGAKKERHLREEAKMNMVHEGRGGVQGFDAIEEEEPVAASEEALVYSNLRMQGPSAPEARGQLKAEGLVERLRDQLARAAPEAADTVRTLSGGELRSMLGMDPGGLAGLVLPMHAVALEHSAGHFAVRYGKESPGEVRADGEVHSLSVLNRRGKVERVYRCVPSVDTNVYQFALFHNPLNLPLLAGPVRVYRGGDFVVSAPLSTTPPGKAITVNLGVEAGIQVARNTHFNESTAGMFGGDTVLEHKVEIEVRSGLTGNARVEVLERVPVSHDEDIKVEVVRMDPRAQRYDQKDRGAIVEGGCKFTLSLKPGEKQKCVLEYKITIPSKQVLVGGNRRD